MDNREVIHHIGLMLFALTVGAAAAASGNAFAATGLFIAGFVIYCILFTNQKPPGHG